MLYAKRVSGRKPGRVSKDVSWAVLTHAGDALPWLAVKSQQVLQLDAHHCTRVEGGDWRPAPGLRESDLLAGQCAAHASATGTSSGVSFRPSGMVHACHYVIEKKYGGMPDGEAMTMEMFNQAPYSSQIDRTERCFVRVRLVDPRFDVNAAQGLMFKLRTLIINGT